MTSMRTRNAALAPLLLAALLAAPAVLADDASLTKDLHISQAPMLMVVEPVADTATAPGGAAAELTVEARADRPDGRYRIGETVRLAVEVSEDAYLWVFDTGTSGKVHRIFPNRFEADNFVRGGATATIPGPGSDYDFRVSSPAGRELITVIATTTAEPLGADLVQEAVAGGSPFLALAGTAASVAKDLSISLREEHPVWTRDVLVVEIAE